MISWLLAKPTSAFLRESLAMYMDASWWGKANTWWCKQFLKEGSYIPIANLLENECFFSAPCEVTYSLAGAFTRFCVETLGRAAFLHSVYRYPGLVKDALEGAFEQGLETTEKNFLIWIGTLDPEEQYTAPIVF